MSENSWWSNIHELLYSIYIAIFNSFHEAVYPVDVITNRSCCMRIIGHNTRTIHRICTECDARIRLWTPFLCAKFQGDRSTRSRYITILCKCAKTRRKNIETLAGRISEMAEMLSFKFGMWTPLAGGQLCSKFSSNRMRDHRDTKV